MFTRWDDDAAGHGTGDLSKPSDFHWPVKPDFTRDGYAPGLTSPAIDSADAGAGHQFTKSFTTVVSAYVYTPAMTAVVRSAGTNWVDVTLSASQGDLLNAYRIDGTRPLRRSPRPWCG